LAFSTLVGFDVVAGHKVLHALDQAGIRIVVALWAKTSEYDEPRFFIASPDFHSDSKLSAHARVSNAVQPEFTWSAPNIVILRMNDPFIQSLRQMFGETTSVDGMRLGGQSIGNRYVEDAYVYLIR
jgi:hypothetical protein